VVVAAPPPKPKPADHPSQADIEALLREQGKLPEDNPPATGVELTINPGYLFWLGEGPFNSKGGPALRASVGARYPWPLSFGLTLFDVAADFGQPGTSAIVTLAPGLYVRAHTQPRKKPHTLDVWGGAGFAPFAFALANFDSSATAAERLAGTTSTAATKQAVAQKLGTDQVVTRQSISIPLELGATFFLTRGVGIDLNVAFTFWLPSEVCYHDSKNRYCVSDGLKMQQSLFVGGGVIILP
jgi:hypothetical protein